MTYFDNICYRLHISLNSEWVKPLATIINNVISNADKETLAEKVETSIYVGEPDLEELEDEIVEQFKSQYPDFHGDDVVFPAVNASCQEWSVA